LEAEGPIAVEFMSHGCAPCRALEPVIEKVAETVKSKEKIFRVNIAVEDELSDSLAMALARSSFSVKNANLCEN